MMAKMCQRILQMLVLIGISISASVGNAAMTIAESFNRLGLQPQASHEQVTKVYRQLAMKHHPDRLVGASVDEIKRNEAQFKEIQEAYENLKNNVDGSAKAGASEAPNNTIADFEKVISGLLLVPSENELISKLSEVWKFQNHVYKDNFASTDGSGYVEISAPAYKLMETFDQLIDRGLFSDLNSAKSYFNLTLNWAFQEHETTFTESIHWDLQQAKILRNLARKGYSLEQILEMLKSITTSVRINVFSGMGRENLGSPQEGGFGRSFKFDLSYYSNSAGQHSKLADAILKGLIEGNQIRNAKELFEVLEILKKEVGHSGYVLVDALAGVVAKALPFLQEMTEAQLLEMVDMSRFYPVEQLALIDAVLKIESNTPRLSAAFLKKLLVTSLESSIGSHGPRFITSDFLDKYYGTPFSDYLNAKGMTKEQFKIAAELKEDKNLLSGPDGKLVLICEMFRGDYFEMLKAHRKVLDRSGFNNGDWNDIRKSLNLGSFDFATEFSFSWLRSNKAINWSKATMTVSSNSKTIVGAAKTLSLGAKACEKLF